jgi:hypothetical protein
MIGWSGPASEIRVPSKFIKHSLRREGRGGSQLQLEADGTDPPG